MAWKKLGSAFSSGFMMIPNWGGTIGAFKDMSAIQRPIDAGGTGQHESQEVQQGQLPNPAPGTDQPSASVPAGE